MVQQQSMKTWSFYRYSLTEEYRDKPTLAPPLIVINHIWSVAIYIAQKCRRCCVDEETKQRSWFAFIIKLNQIY